METIVRNAAVRARHVVSNGREYLVAPLVMIVPGVLNGSRGPLYYPAEEIATEPARWNGMPLVVYHPTGSGGNVSARDPEVMTRQEVGRVYKAAIRPRDGALTAEGWFDAEATRRVDMRVYNALLKGQPIELSTGLFTDNHPAPVNASYNGRGYVSVARNYRPDHLAILPDQVGACSVRDGCGVLVNSRNLAREWIEAVGNCGGTGGKPGPCPTGGTSHTPESVHALYERAASAHGHEIEAGVGALPGMSKSHLTELAAKVGIHHGSSVSKKWLVDQIGARLRDRHGAAIRRGLIGRPTGNYSPLENCGGPGGKPGPCPTGSASPHAGLHESAAAVSASEKVAGFRPQATHMKKALAEFGASGSGMSPAAHGLLAAYHESMAAAHSGSGQTLSRTAAMAHKTAAGVHAKLSNHPTHNTEWSVLNCACGGTCDKCATANAGPECPECGSTDTESMGRGGGKMVCNKCGHTFSSPTSVAATKNFEGDSEQTKRVKPKRLPWEPRVYNAIPSAGLDMTPDKACKILKDGTVHGKPLTKHQRGMFGAKCGQRQKVKNEEWAEVENCGGKGGKPGPCPTGGGGDLDAAEAAYGVAARKVHKGGSLNPGMIAVAPDEHLHELHHTSLAYSAAAKRHGQHGTARIIGGVSKLVAKELKKRGKSPTGNQDWSPTTENAGAGWREL